MQESGVMIKMNKYPVPEGWKLVPMEPTVEMRRKAGLSRGTDYYTISKVWEAMLAAAPVPPCKSPVIDNAGCESEVAESERQPERDEGDIFDRVQEVITAVYDREMQIEDAAREVIDLCDAAAKLEASHD